MTDNDQISRFLARLPVETSEEVDPDAPLAVFDSALELTREQEDDMVTHAMRRYRELCEELGRDQTAGSEGSNSGGGNWYVEGGSQAQTTAKTFLGRRQLYEMVYHNEVDWRRTLIGGIYEEHNINIPAARRVVQQQIARADNYLFGSEPWVSVAPVGSDDKELANNIDKWAKYRFEKSKAIEAHKQANEGAFIRGEDVLKTTFKKDEDFHESIVNVLIGGDGNPVIADDGDYIFFDDGWIESPETQKMVLRRDMTTEPPEGVLDPETGAPSEEFFKVTKVSRSLKKYEGASTEVIYYMDFLCPLNSPTIEDADTCVHVFDRPAIKIASQLIDLVAETQDKSKLPRILEILNNISATSSERVGQTSKSRAEEGEDMGQSVTGSDHNNPIVNLGEFYLRYDPFGDGRGERSIIMLVDLDSEEPIYYDYVANVTPDGKRPFHCVRINPINGRWHGSGNMETYWTLQEMIDLLANRWNQSQSGSARVDFWNPAAVYEGDDDPDLQLNGGETYTLKPNKTKDDALQSVFLTDIKSDRIHEQIQYLQQHLMNMGGVANANDSRSAGLDTSQLATGINNIQQSGEELFTPWLSHLTPGHESAVEASLMIEIEKMDKKSVYHYFENKIRRMGSISKSELKYLDLDIKIELTRHRTERELVQNEKAYAVFMRYYALPPDLQALWRNHAIRTLSNLEVVDADSLILEPGTYGEKPIWLGEYGMLPQMPTDTVGSGLGDSAMVA